VTATSPSVRYRDLLAVRQMRAVLLAHSVSMTGSVVAEVALSVLLYARTGSSLLSAAALALGFLPNVLGGTVLSGLADRFPVRRLLVACDLLSAAVVTLMLVPGLPIWALLGLVVLLGTVPPVFNSARSADLAGALAGGLWLLARSALRVLAQTTLVGGFALGGLLLTMMGPRELLLVDAVSFLLSAAVLRAGTPARPARTPHARGQGPSPAAESRLALQLLSRRPRLRRLLLLGWLPWTFASAADGLAVTYSARVGAGAAGASLLLCALAGGTVLGELLAARLRRHFGGVWSCRWPWPCSYRCWDSRSARPCRWPRRCWCWWGWAPAMRRGSTPWCSPRWTGPNGATCWPSSPRG